VTVRGDRVALQRLVENLLENARRHGPGGGRVRLSVRGEDGQALVEVSDEGPGPAPGEAERTFERFWRAPGARGEGSGLGLAIVRVTAERHGGRAGVEGSRFWVELPTAGAKADVSGPDRALAST
jgi:signal transduction histidine kinase